MPVFEGARSIKITIFYLILAVLLKKIVPKLDYTQHER